MAVISAQAAPPRAERTPSRSPEGILARADGVELLGEYEDSGFRVPPLLARRGDGQMIKLTPLLYRVAAACDGRRDAEQVAAIVSEHLGRAVSAANVRQLADAQLRPLGVLTQPDGTSPELPKRHALLALRHRRPILPARAVNAIAAMFTWLHAAPLRAAFLAALLLFDAWLFGLHGIAGGIRHVLYEPAWLLAVLGSIILATAFHEIGHASACRHAGGRPGEMGIGLYLVWPAFYCDVTDAYQLDRRGRLRTDLGGIYFNGLFALACGTAYFTTGHEALLFAAFAQHIIILQQLLPLLRFDGYYVLSDLTGVPDILSRIKPIFRSLLRGRRREPKVAELKPWVRLIVTTYLLALIPALALLITAIVLAAPRMIATAYDSFWLQLDRLDGANGIAQTTVAIFRIAALVLPLAAVSLSLSRTSRLGIRAITHWSRNSLPRQLVALTALTTITGAIALLWWPNGDYQPIRPGERGTIGEAVNAVPQIPTGRPAFTPQRAVEFGSIPTARERSTAAGAHRDGGGGRGGGGDAITAPEPATRPIGDLGDGEIPAGGSDPGMDVPQDSGSTATPEPPAAGTPAPANGAPASGTAPPGDPTPAGTTEPAPTSTSAPAPTATATPTPSGTATPGATAAPETTAAPDGTALGGPAPVTGAQTPETSVPTPAPTP